MNKKTHSNEIALTLDRIEGNRAVLILDREEIAIPKKYLPADAKGGEQIVMILTNDEALRKQKEERAKKLLNEILANGR